MKSVGLTWLLTFTSATATLAAFGAAPSSPDATVSAQASGAPEAPAPTSRTPPTLKKRPHVGYPMDMSDRRMSGEVKLRFLVDVNGKVQNPVVLATTHVGFNDAALRYIRDFEFAPGTENGRPVAMEMEETMVFQYRGSTNEYVPLAVRELVTSLKAAQSDPSQRLDVTPKPKTPVKPVYPYALLRDNIAGRARLRYRVSAGGRVDGYDVLETTREEFALALIAAVEATEFTPADLHGQPVSMLVINEQGFQPDAESLVSPEERRMLDRELGHSDTIVSPKRLDAPLQPLAQVAPTFPLSLSGSVATGTATIELIVDEAGAVRLPRVVKADAPELGYAAAQACAGWKFAPPRANGQAVAVRARVPFRFAGPKPTDTAAR